MNRLSSALIAFVVCLAAAASATCVDTTTIDCPSGIVCPEGTQCAAAQPVCIRDDCGNAGLDSGETCDDGNTRDGDDCNATCDDGDENADCGCLVAPRRGGPDGRSFVLLAAAAAVLLRARRRRRGRTCRPG